MKRRERKGEGEREECKRREERRRKGKEVVAETSRKPPTFSLTFVCVLGGARFVTVLSSMYWVLIPLYFRVL